MKKPPQRHHIQDKLKAAPKQQPNENSALAADDSTTNNLSV